MAKLKKSSKGDESVIIKKPVENIPDVTDTPAIIEDSPKSVIENVKNTIPDIIYGTNASPKKHRKPRSPNKTVTLDPNEKSKSSFKDKSALFYVGLSVGIIAGSIGIFLLYNYLKKNYGKSPEDKLLDEITREKVIKLEKIKREQ